MVEPNEDLQVPSMGLRISVQTLFIVSLTCDHVASGSFLALLKILCFLNTYYLQYILLNVVEETKMIMTPFLLSSSLSPIWIDRQALIWQSSGLLHAGGPTHYKNAKEARGNNFGRRNVKVWTI